MCIQEDPDEVHTDSVLTWEKEEGCAKSQPILNSNLTPEQKKLFWRTLTRV